MIAESENKGRRLAEAILASCQTELQTARLWLILRLLDGPVIATTVRRDAEDAGISVWTLYRARKGLARYWREHRWAGYFYWELSEQLQTEGVDRIKEETIAKLMERMR